MSDSASAEKGSILANSGVVYPLLIALAILLYTMYEHKAKLYAQYCALGKGRFLREVTTWMGLLFLGFFAHSCLEQTPSTILTVGAAMSLESVLCLSFPRSDKPTATSGASPVALLLLALSLVLRLACTMRVSAYLPDDHTGDWIYQLIEVLSLINCLREFLVWQDHPDSLYVSNRTMNLGFAAVMACAIGASQCHGDLASRPLTDQAFAAAAYVELMAWFFQAEAMFRMKKEDMNLNFVVTAAGGVLCRTYFWDLAAVEITPAKPIAFQQHFPTALVSCHIFMAGILAGLSVLCLCKRLGIGMQVRQMAPQQQMQQMQMPQQMQMQMPQQPYLAPYANMQPPAFLAGMPQAPVFLPQMPMPPQMPAMPPQMPQMPQPPASMQAGYGGMAKHPYMEFSKPAPTEAPATPPATKQPDVFPDLSVELPPGCTQFVPVSSKFQNGELVVVYKPM